MARTTERKTAEERREEILEAARLEFAERGLDGTSTDDIARRAGVSQPYLFRLFGTKKELFLAAIARCFGETLEMFETAAAGLHGEDALRAMGTAYTERIAVNPGLLRLQMQSYAACDDPDICAAVQRGYGDLVDFVERSTAAGPAGVTRFFAKGMLLNVIASMELLGSDEPWAKRLIEGCRSDEDA
jgi:AcrR family transcriptional regulator